MNATKIEWTDRTWNPLTGCTKVTPGCDHCYAKTMHERFNGPGSFDTVELHPDRLDQPLRWRKPARVFVNSMSDLFHQDVPDEFIARVFAVMALAQRHTFQILTKRHARMRSLLNSADFWCGVHREVNRRYDSGQGEHPGWVPEQRDLDNVWLGVSVETQQWADIRIPALLDTPAAVRFLSCEPLLGPVDLDNASGGAAPDAIDWVIVGGESGRGARPMHPDWARTLRDQCAAAAVPFLFKQWGEWIRVDHPDQIAGLGRNAPMLHHQRETYACVGKKAAGRELDGRTWDEYPAGAA